MADRPQGLEYGAQRKGRTAPRPTSSTTGEGQNRGDIKAKTEAKAKRYATFPPRMSYTRTCSSTQHEVHAHAAPKRPSTWLTRKPTHTKQTLDMMEQEHQDDAQGEPTTPTPSTPTTTTTRKGGQHPADPNNLGSPSNGSRGQAPGEHTPSPTHTVYRAHRGATTQCQTGHYPSTTDTTGSQGGWATGEGTTRRQLVDPEPDHAPSQRTDHSATDRTASTTSRQCTPSLDRTEYSTQNTDYSHIPRRDTNDHESPSDRSRGRTPGTHTPSPTHTVYSTQREEPRSTRATTQGHTDHSPGTTDSARLHG